MASEIKLSDYKQPVFWTQTVDLTICINNNDAIVENISSYTRNREGNSLVLEGQDLELLEVKVNDNIRDLQPNSNGQLEIDDLPDGFTLYTKVRIKPDENFSGEGLYKSGSIYCTQCEAEGFRRITFHQDRPDVMSSYTTKIIADKSKFPFLLSNGDRIDSGDLEDGKHFATWKDPHKKPSYLFAMVAGDLEQVVDQFTTQSGRKVSLEFFVDRGNRDKCGHAMQSLKNSMKWDEDRFGLEYDLDTYMIVAVDAFNMGAMENKGLNIFNSAYVLAKPETATDRDFQGIEGVIGHEYFHNWTGNRVTCRDWFQLTLKEGLTVFRDQEFSADMNSRPVKRIDDVRVLKSHQFPEDAGPLSHPIKPKAYMEINNFYTATVYEKGAEVIRMIHTLLGEKNFRKGMDLYFERHDGQAVTTEDFVAAMSDASGIDLERFKNWYDQNGTPTLTISTNYKKGKFHALITHTTKMNNKDSSLHFPFAFSLYSKKGKLLYTDPDFQINQNPQTLVVEGLVEEPIVSWNEGFSAPVLFETDYTFDELSILMGHCQDSFNRFEFAQILIYKQIDELIGQSRKSEDFTCDGRFLSAYRSLLIDEELDDSLKAYALSIPTVKDYNDRLTVFDLEHAPKAINFLKQALADHNRDSLYSLVERYHESGDFKVDAASMGKRALKHQALNLLSSLKTEKSYELIFDLFSNATNMTDEIGTLALLASHANQFRDRSLTMFFDKWKHETLVMQKWLSVQAKNDDTGPQALQALERSPVFDEKVPNLLRSVMGTFIHHNIMGLNQADGSGYRYSCKRILEIDKFNPQAAARLAKGLSILKKLDSDRQNLLREELIKLKKTPDLSKDTLEVIASNLA